MNLAALRSVLLALALSACSQAEPPVPEFETVTIDLREPALGLGDKGPGVPLPARKPASTAAAPTSSHEPAVASAPYVPRMPDFRQITACPGGITCQAFAN